MITNENHLLWRFSVKSLWLLKKLIIIIEIKKHREQEYLWTLREFKTIKSFIDDDSMRFLFFLHSAERTERKANIF